MLIADNVNGTKKRHIVRELGLNLEEEEKNVILSIIKKVRDGDIDKLSAFALIKAELSNSDDYNDAEVVLRIGKRRKQKVRWNDFEKIMGTHDISNSLYERYSISRDFEGELRKLADEYYFEIVEAVEV